MRFCTLFENDQVGAHLLSGMCGKQNEYGISNWNTFVVPYCIEWHAI